MKIDNKYLGKLQKMDCTGPMQHSQYYKLISTVMGMIHGQIPKEKYNTKRVAAPTNIREENFRGSVHNRAVMFLMSNGCEWAIKNGNGCTMCGHIAKQTREENLISTSDYMDQFVAEFEQIDFKQNPLLNLFNNGSFLNDNEIAREAQIAMLKMVNAHPDIQMLVVETRPEFVTEENIKMIKEYVPDKYVEVAMGLELKDDYYRTICINKGFSLQQYDRAAEIIAKHLQLRTYVLLKPPFLSEREGMEQAIATIKHAFAKGSSTVSLEGCTVQDYTLVKYLFDRGQYSSPWLWSIIEVLRQTSHLGKLVVGLFQFYPSPTAVPYNCDQCSDQLLEKLKLYNRSLDLHVFDGVDCNCRQQWETLLNAETVPFEERLAVLLEDESLDYVEL